MAYRPRATDLVMGGRERRYRGEGRKRRTNKPVKALYGTVVSCKCKVGRHKECTKLDCPCECHPKV